MKRTLFIIGGGLIVLVGAAAAVPFLIPDEVYRAQIEKAATNALGREVSLNGDVSISLIPSVGARVSNVTVANPDGFSREHMIEAGELRGVVKWGPLLSRRVEIAELAFVDADVMLERRANGDTNWTFGDDAPEDTPSDGGGGSVDGGIDRASLSNARLVYADAQTGAHYEISELDLTASMRALDAPLSLDADGNFQARPFSVSLTLDAPQSIIDGTPAGINAAIGLEDGKADFNGAITLGDTIMLDGGFGVEGRALSDLAALSGISVPYNLDALGSVRVAGTMSGDIGEYGNLAITLTGADITGDGLNANYSGNITVTDTIAVDGRTQIESGDLPAWLDTFGLRVPDAVRVLEDVSVSSDVSGTLDALTLNNLSLVQQGPLLDARFDGRLAMGGSGQISGHTDISSGRMRDMLAVLGVEMAPGDTLRQFSVESELSGTLSRIGFSQLDGRLDDVRTTGDLDLNLETTTPEITGNLSTGTLDLSPFLQSGEASQSSGADWSDEPLDLAGLRAVNADVHITADQIIIGDITLGAPRLGARLTNGNLVASVDSMQLFGGGWNGTFGLDASGAEPALNIDFTGQTIEVSSALQSLAGIGALAGLGDVRVDVTSRGASVKALIEGLDGEMGSNLSNGVLRGINLGQIVRSRNNIVEALANGTLAMALEPEAETDFTSMIAGLSLNNGIAQIDTFSLDNPLFALEGSGQINFGERTLDIGIVPEIDASGQSAGSSIQLNGIPIPFRVSGDWLSPNLSPDTRMIQRILAQDLTNRAQERLIDELGGDAGGVLGEILGRPRPTTTPAPTPESSAEAPAEVTPAPEPAPERSVEDELEDAGRDLVRGALGDLLGQRDEPEQESETEAEPQ